MVQVASPPGEPVAARRDRARRPGGCLHLGSVLERGADGALHNTAVLLDPAGQIAHAYRKIHVFGYQSLEAELLTSGVAVKVADTELGPVSATTCYDLRFPELWRGAGGPPRADRDRPRGLAGGPPRPLAAVHRVPGGGGAGARPRPVRGARRRRHGRVLRAGRVWAVTGIGCAVVFLGHAAARQMVRHRGIAPT
jgi:Carbon-nitrogen hydrolase